MEKSNSPAYANAQPCLESEFSEVRRISPRRAWISRLFPVFSHSLREIDAVASRENRTLGLIFAGERTRPVAAANREVTGSGSGHERPGHDMRAPCGRSWRKMLQFLVTRAGPLASLDREPRQAREGAAVTVDAGAGVWLVRVAARFASASTKSSTISVDCSRSRSSSHLRP